MVSPPRGIHADVSNCVAVLPVDEETVMLASADSQIKLINLPTGRHGEVINLAMRPSITELAPASESRFLVASYFGTIEMDFAVVEVELSPSIVDYIGAAFRTADSGDIAGYAEQVVRITDRNMPQPTAVEPELNSLFNDVGHQVSQRLLSRVTQLAQESGLENATIDPIPRGLDGWPPPEYGGGASQPRWRFPGAEDRAWLEASIGVSHRAWPEVNLNDLVITLIVARMTESSQHTILTRFVPCELEDPALGEKIDALLADVEEILPDAFAEFRALTVGHTA
jgi:hypothetical protein